MGDIMDQAGIVTPGHFQRAAVVAAEICHYDWIPFSVQIQLRSPNRSRPLLLRIRGLQSCRSVVTAGVWGMKAWRMFCECWLMDAGWIVRTTASAA